MKLMFSYTVLCVQFDKIFEVDFLVKVHDVDYAHETKGASQFAL